MKPDNIFMGAPDPQRYPLYPKPLLGDFGIAIMSPEIDPNNPDWYNAGDGTPGLLAPEQKRFFDADDLTPIDDFALSSWTNVYGVGLILWILITYDGGPPDYNGPKQREWLGTGLQHDPLDFSANTPALTYSQSLREMIMSCLEYDVLQRPTFQDLQRRIAFETDERPGWPNRSFHMRSGVALPDVRHANRVLWEQDRYRLGLRRDEIE